MSLCATVLREQRLASEREVAALPPRYALEEDRRGVTKHGWRIWDRSEKLFVLADWGHTQSVALIDALNCGRVKVRPPVSMAPLYGGAP